ncbi:putative tricarboxylic transport membrane protein [Halopolyspora algeriensis]|uniref:Putative tricarboxylic transport membrane protein n=1 Tax=Halopolyspora algeriensis TaxID=1500506 RepID=A0A368VK54_9ACTN|nr:tripartite tricarboxylate transporter substrate binding protein [Halopolyspora algeriensis]RCW40929.1 putative tricarboxylic transport membrane protein [Halopolyspora algeriensis]TQM53985.1 putative tricarboxylic transport membrane protein [Halopolyspora algeriensis]
MRIRRSRPAAFVAAACALALTLAGCGGAAGGGSGEGSGGVALDRLRIMAPASPGGGWDLTSRTAQQSMEKAGVADTVEVFNVPGAGGTIGLSRLAGERGNGNLLMTTGLVMVGAVQTNDSRHTLRDVTPIARLTSAYEVIVVPADSPYKNLGDLIAAWKKDPGSVAIAGGSAGGVDQILAGLLAQKAGVDPTKVNYVAFSGGGQSLAAILGGKVDAGISGLAEYIGQIKAGKLRALAVSSPTPMEGIDIPTIKQAGVDLSLANWRGFVAPPGLKPDEKQALIQAVEKMHGTEQWQQALEKNNWKDSFTTGEEFKAFLDGERKQVTSVLKDLGLA